MRGYIKTPDQVHAIEDAFADGMPLRTVVRKFGVGSQTAQNIRDGQHPLQNEDNLYHRCPGCGGKVLMPCILCHVREVISQERSRNLLLKDMKDRRQEVDAEGWR